MEEKNGAIDTLFFCGSIPPDVEQYLVDESFVDMTGTEGLWGDPVTAANRI